MFRGSIIFGALLVSGCSAAILSIGQDETSVIHWGSKKGEINRYLGSPIQDELLTPPLRAFDLHGTAPVELLIYSHAITNADGTISYPPPADIAVRRDVYLYKGRIERKYDVGEAVAMAGYTFFLSELIMVPASLKTQYNRGHMIHHVTVWFDQNDVALAYLWKSEDES